MLRLAGKAYLAVGAVLLTIVLVAHVPLAIELRR